MGEKMRIYFKKLFMPIMRRYYVWRLRLAMRNMSYYLGQTLVITIGETVDAINAFVKSFSDLAEDVLDEFCEPEGEKNA